MNKGDLLLVITIKGKKLTDFPAHLDLHEQGRFAIGYYHQRQAFFTAKNDNADNPQK